MYTIKHKALLITAIVGLLVGAVLLGAFTPQTINADVQDPAIDGPIAKVFCGLDRYSHDVVKQITMVVTAYSSTPEQTDDTPFITASGKHVSDGIIANNLLPFGTKIRIPELYGDKVFTVEDRMNSRMGTRHVDIWFSNTQQAVDFGAKVTKVEILQS